MKKVLITGGAGFIAKNLQEHLKNEYSVSSFDRKDLDLLDSAGVFEHLKKSKFDVVIHAATYDAAARFSKNDPARVLENNLKMFFNLARYQDYFGKMVYFGSGAEFGRENWVPKMKEDYFDKYIPTDQYGFSKYIMTKYAQSHKNIYNLRLFGTFGKHDDWRTRFIPNACCHAVFNMPIRIDQNRYYDFLCVDDLIKIVQWFIDNKPKHKVYNICTGRVIDFETIAKKIVKISGKNLNIEIKTEGLASEYSGDNSMLTSEIKKFKFGSIDEQIKNLYSWYDLNKNIIKKNEL